MVSTSEFKAGMIIKYENGLWEILEYQLVKMQQRQPIVRTKMRNIRTGNVLEQPFRSGEKFEDLYLEEKPLQYLYRDGERFHFMDSEAYHEVVVSAAAIGDKADFLRENDEVTGRYADEELISIELPSSVVLEITETEPGVRGDTAKSGSKPAKVETGATIRVPLFISTGDKVRVDTRTRQYLERA